MTAAATARVSGRMRSVEAGGTEGGVVILDQHSRAPWDAPTALFALPLSNGFNCHGTPNGTGMGTEKGRCPCKLGIVSDGGTACSSSSD